MRAVGGTQADLALGARGQGQAQNDDLAECVLPVRWFASKPRADAYGETGMFANQNSGCKLRQELTLDRLATHFDISGEN